MNIRTLRFCSDHSRCASGVEHVIGPRLGLVVHPNRNFLDNAFPNIPESGSLLVEFLFLALIEMSESALLWLLIPGMSAADSHALLQGVREGSDIAIGPNLEDETCNHWAKLESVAAKHIENRTHSFYHLSASQNAPSDIATHCAIMPTTSAGMVAIPLE